MNKHDDCHCDAPIDCSDSPLLGVIVGILLVGLILLMKVIYPS